MSNQNDLRTRVRILKAVKAIKGYREVAEYLKVSTGTFSQFMCNSFDFGPTKANYLKRFIEDREKVANNG